MYRHVESRRKQSRRPESGMPGHYATTTTTTERSRASSIPTSDGATYGLGLSNLSRADDIQYNQHVIPQTSYAGEEASWPLVAPDSTLLPSSAAEEHYDTLSTPFHHQLLGHNDVPTTVSLFQQSTPSPIPGPLLQPYPQYRPETGQHFASALHLASSHATENLDLEISPSVKPEEDYNDWLPDQSDSGSSLSAQPSEIYDTPPQLQPSPHRSWQAHSNFNQVQNFAQLEQPSGKLPIRSSKRASIGHHPPCQCSFCGQLFGKRSNLKTHEQYKHSPNYVKRFECPTTGCGRKFDRKMDLKRHIKSVSGQFGCSTI